MRKQGGIVVIWLVCGLLLAGGIYFVSAGNADRPVAVQGVLDLSRWDPAADSVVYLRGEWEFYWERLLEPSDLETRSQMTGFITLPGSWNGYEIGGKKLGGEGYATFALTMKTGATGERLALSISGITTAYRLWVNDELKVSVGTVGTSVDTMTAREATTYIEFVDDHPETRLVIQVSNFLHRRGGIWAGLELGTASTIETLTDWRVFVDMSSYGALVIMGIYHLGLFIQRKRDKSTLYFGLLCLSFSVRALLVGQAIITRLFPTLSWTLLLTTEYVTSATFLPLCAAYTEVSYPAEASARVTAAAKVVSLAFASVALTTSPWVSSRLVPSHEMSVSIICVFIFRTLYMAVVRKRPGAKFMAAGAAVFGFTILSDMLYFQEIIGFGNFSQLGLVFLCFMQSYWLSVRFSGAFSDVEQLSKQLASVNSELTDLNRHLESRVDRRTSELLESNRKLEAINKEIARIEESRRHLLANIAHDLRTPVTLVRGYAEAILDGVIEGPGAVARCLGLIRSKAGGLTALIDDLFELTQLESRRTAFNPRPADVSDLVEKLYRKYEHDIVSAGLIPMLRLPAPTEGQTPVYVSADLDQIDRVIANLVYNAIKFTPKGGWIAVGYSLDETGSDEATIKVEDNGPGIGEHDVPFIFDRFYKAPRARTSAAGSGLGLSIAKEIVDLHGGRIWVKSKQGQGNSFCFSLPIVPPIDELPE